MVLDAVNELSDEKRICVLLHYYNEMSVADIAETVGANENTVKSRLFQARKDLSAKFKDLERKGLYGFSPVGLVLWAWQNTEQSVAEGFIGSETASTILASVTANAGAGAASAATTVTAAASGTTAAVGSGVTATASASAATSAVSAGTGIAAKIAALTVAQKVVAGIAITGVVAGSAAGTATVIKNGTFSKSEETTTTAIYAVGDEVATSSEWLESNVVITESSESETTDEVLSVLATLTTKTTEKRTEEPSCTVAKTTKKSEENKSETQKPSETEKKTRRTTTRRDYSLDYTKQSTIASTTHTTTGLTATTTTTNATTTAESTTTTTKPTTTTTTTRPTTTEATTITVPKANLTIIVLGLDGEPEAEETIEVDGNSFISSQFILDNVENGVEGRYYSAEDIYMIDLPYGGYEIQPGENFTVYVML